MRTATALSLLTAVTLALSGCSAAQDGPTTTAPAASTGTSDGASAETSTQGPATAAQLSPGLVDKLAAYDVQTSDVRELITGLDRVQQARPLAVQASVRHDSVVVTDGTDEVTLPVPGDEVYVSIAPYASTTHDCFFHALGGCQGELVGEDVHVTITADDGEVLVDEDTTTYANGFVGYWLPKDRAGTVTITSAGQTGQTPFDTGPDGATCLTTLQLR